LATRQRRVILKDWTLARPEWVTTPARGNQKNLQGFQNLEGCVMSFIQSGNAITRIKLTFVKSNA